MLQHEAGKPVIGIRIAGRMALYFPAQCIVIGVIPEIVAILHKGQAALIGRDLQAVATQIQIACHFGAQQAADIGTVGIGPARMQFPADRRPTDPVILFNDQRLQARPGQITARRQAIMTRPYNNCIILICHISSARRLGRLMVSTPKDNRGEQQASILFFERLFK